MGKNLKGKEIGKGLCQRKDGLYVARFVNRYGKRTTKCFPTVPEARNWLDEARYADSHADIFVPSEMTVNDWFDFWIKSIVGDLAPNTLRNYRERYERNMKPVLGKLKLSDVKPLHCKMVLNRMDADYAGSTIRQTYITMGAMFKSAKMNDLIVKHPMDGVRYTKPVRAVSDIKFLTVEEQDKFLQVAKRSHNYFQYALILETGLRTGEMIGLTWDAIDWKKRTLTVNKTLEYRHKQGYWRAGPPKTQQSYRTIPLTAKAYAILEMIASRVGERKESETLSQTLEYIDRRTGQTSTLVMQDLVFINFRTGEPAKNSSYDTHLYKLCDEAGIKRFSMHVLRHTYATRAIERGVQPKVLQKLLGHASIKTTMDRYVHVTDESLAKAIKQFEGLSSLSNDEGGVP
jgi:integrase